jgi:glycolate oxidase
MNQNIKDALVKIVGKKNFTEELIDLVSYSSDASLNQSRPLAAVCPATTEQVAEIMKLARQEGLAVTPRGAGTGLSGMAVPVNGGLVLDMARMNKIKSIRIEDRVVVVEPGVVYGDLAKELIPHGFAFPPDPSSGVVATVGGNVATDAGGIKGAKYGTTKDYVMALEVVLPDGRIMRTGSACMKSVSGYDLTHLFVGSEGTLGVITEITLKINPIPPLSSTAMATFDRLDEAGQAVSEIMHSGILPSVLEIIDEPTLKAINENTNMGLPEVEAMLLAETEGHTETEVQFQMDRVKEIFKKNGASTIRQAKDAQEAADLWTARKSGYGVLARINKNLLVEDCSVPMSHVAELLRTVQEVAEKHDLVITTVGHAGDGNLHPTVCFDASDPEVNQRAHDAAQELFEKVISLGGTLTGEHGIGLDKARFMSMEHDPVEMEVMRTFKKALDPDNRMNPGKMALDG